MSERVSSERQGNHAPLQAAFVCLLFSGSGTGAVTLALGHGSLGEVPICVNCCNHEHFYVHSQGHIMGCHFVEVSIPCELSW